MLVPKGFRYVHNDDPTKPRLFHELKPGIMKMLKDAAAPYGLIYVEPVENTITLQMGVVGGRQFGCSFAVLELNHREDPRKVIEHFIAAAARKHGYNLNPNASAGAAPNPASVKMPGCTKRHLS